MRIHILVRYILAVSLLLAAVYAPAFAGVKARRGQFHLFTLRDWRQWLWLVKARRGQFHLFTLRDWRQWSVPPLQPSRRWLSFGPLVSTIRPLTMIPATTSITEAQRDMRWAYFGGATGLFASAFVWLVSGVVALRDPAPQHAFLTLFFGGMLIYPLAMLLSKAFGRSGAHHPGNPLGRLAMEGTFVLLLGLVLAYAAAQAHAQWFFPAMLLVIGGRYLTFSTLYGLRWYWVCGALLAVAGLTTGKLQVAPSVAAFTGAAIEAVFATVIFVVVRRDPAA